MVGEGIGCGRDAQKEIMKIVFLDRDGVINKYPGDRKYVTGLENFFMLPGSAKAIAALCRAGYSIFVVSNQAGIAKGVYSRKNLDLITRELLKNVRAKGGKIKKVLYCLHTDTMRCACRKPKDGLLRLAARGSRIDKKESFMIGDSLLDIKAGKSFGCKTILVLSGREKLSRSPSWDESPDFIAKNLAQAAKNIIENKYSRA